MNKNYRKTVSFLAALSMVSASVILPSAAFADGNGIIVDGTTASVTTDKVGVTIVASYDENGRLTAAKMQEAAVGTSTVDVNAGDKIMLWDGIGSEANEPIVDAVKVEAPVEPTATPEETATPTPDVTEKPEETATPTPDVTATPDTTTKPDETEAPSGKTWKFDFGTADDVAEGYTAVTADVNYIANGTYGFIGTDENDFRLGPRLDGFDQQKGQIIQLTAGAGTGLNDGIGSTGADDFGNAGDKYYPVRFALKVEDEQYFKVKATVTTLDNTKPASASLYTERKHPLYTQKTINPGETVTTEFTIRTTPIYYQKSDPQGEIADGMVNVAVLGENTALAALEIEQLESAPVLWVLGDSTVTDGGGTLPFWPLQNYTGVGTGLTKYLRSDYAMVNEGEGGLNAADNAHFDMVKERIKAGDYMYVEYGHNHKTDGPTGYVNSLAKYYDACHNVGAKLIVVSPIERINTWDSATSTYQQTLNGFADAGEQYVKDKVAAGATDIAYVDLNDYSINCYNKIVADNGNSEESIKYYFRVARGEGVDRTHPNDAGAENFAYEFFKAAQAVTDETQKAVLADLLENMSSETPNLVSADVMAGGLGGDAWPIYVIQDLPELPVVINDVKFDESGYVSQVDVTTRQAKLAMEAYGIIEITIINSDDTEAGKVYAIDQVDNSTGYGPQTIVNFTKDVALTEGCTYKAKVLKAVDNGGDIGLTVDPENLAYSAEYVPTDISDYIITGENGGVETFEYYNASSLTDATVWKSGGSAGQTLTLGDDNGVKFAKIASDGAKNGAAGQGSFYVMRELENLKDENDANVGTGTSGKYIIDVDAKYVSGGGLNFAFAKNTTPTKSPFISEEFVAFTIGNSGEVTIAGHEGSIGQVSASAWTNIKYILDMNAGTASIAVAGGTPVEVSVPAYATFGTPSPDTLKHFVLEGQKVAFDINLSKLTVGKLKDTAMTTTLSVVSADETMGTATIADAEGSSVTVAQSSTATVNAVPNAGYVFTGWTADSAEFSDSNPLTLRMYKDLALTATFAKQAGVEGIVNYALTADKSLLKAADGATATISVADVVDNAGNPVKYEASDVTWSCDEAGVTVEDGVVTLGADFVVDANSTKDIAVKATLNNIEKTYTLTAYSYAFYENGKGGKASAAWDGPVSDVASKNGLAFPAGNGVATLTLPEAVSLEGTTTISFIAAGSGSASKFCGQPRYIEVYDSNGAKVINEVIGYSWQNLTVGGTIGGSSIDNGTNFANAVALNAWSEPVTITLNGDGTGTVSFGGATADVTVNADAADIASVKFQAKSGAPDYLTRGLSFTDITIVK